MKSIFYQDEKRPKIPALLFPRAALLSAASVAVLHVIFMLLSGKGLFAENPYNSYAKQAAAWAQGQLDLGRDYPWLELAIFEGHYYVSFPPFPSYVLFPFALVFGENTPDSLIAFLVTLTGAWYAGKLGMKAGLKESASVLLAVFLYCANNLWQITVDGWVWFFAQNLSFTLTTASLYYALDSRKGRSLFCLCAAVGCRPFQILWLPLVCLLLLRSSGKGLRWLLWERDIRCLPAALLALSFLLLNFARFGDPLEFGHNYLPEFTESAYGQFSLSYLGENLQSLFRLPAWEDGRLLFPAHNGCNIFLVYPLLILWLGSAVYRGWLRKAEGAKAVFHGLGFDLWVLLFLALHLLLFCCHKTMGGAHFGNRYAADPMPAVYLALLLNTARLPKNSLEGGASWRTWIFFLIFLCGLLLNFTGVLNFYVS